MTELEALQTEYDEYKKEVHNKNNSIQYKMSVIEAENIKVKKVLTDVLNFEVGSWSRAKDLLASLVEDK